MSSNLLSFRVTSALWHAAVPPANDRRVVIMQRLDGPFAEHVVGDRGQYYVSVEAYDKKLTRWDYVQGSCIGSYRSYAEASAVAELVWKSEAASADRLSQT